MFFFIFNLLICNDKKFAVDFVEMAFLLYLCLQKNDDLIMENIEQKNPIDEARRYEVIRDAQRNVIQLHIRPEGIRISIRTREHHIHGTITELFLSKHNAVRCQTTDAMEVISFSIRIEP